MELILVLFMVGTVVWFVVGAISVVKSWRATRRPETSSRWNVILRQNIVLTLTAAFITLIIVSKWLSLYQQDTVGSDWSTRSLWAACGVGFVAFMASLESHRYKNYEATHRTYGVGRWRDDGR
jgi:hypothetical protein